MKITAELMDFRELNALINETADKTVEIDRCLGQRYIGSGMKGKHIAINGTAGNALGAYMDGAEIEVFGNAQDAAGDTMNDGEITVHGSAGDATGYAMRGGAIYVEGDVGYRAGIHMKEYTGKIPAVIIGGCAGSFLGEYQAGGYICVLNIENSAAPVGNFCGTGMHGGKMFIRCESLPKALPRQVKAEKATKDDMREIAPYIKRFCEKFGKDPGAVSGGFYVLTPDTKNPYTRLYTMN